MIDYNLLRALEAVISNRGFERAAQKLFITQSAVSRRIRQLEEYMGEPVIVRTQPPVATSAGQRLLTHLQQVTQLEAALGVETDALNTSKRILSVRMAINADSLATWLPRALAIPDYPFSFDFLVEDQSVSLKRMKQGEVMVCICSSPDPVNGGKVDYLGALRYRAVASPEFLKKHNIQQMADLQHAPCLVFDHNDRTQHDFLLQHANFDPEYIHWCPSSEGFNQAMQAGLGFGMLPELQIADSIETGRLSDLFPGKFMDIPLYWHYWQTESPYLMELRTFAIKTARSYLI